MQQVECKDTRAHNKHAVCSTLKFRKIKTQIDYIILTIMFEGSQSLQGNSKNIIECAVLKRNFDANRIALNTSELPFPKNKKLNKKYL